MVELSRYLFYMHIGTQNCLVELPGVEPGSKQVTEETSTCLACFQLSGGEREQAP